MKPNGQSKHEHRLRRWPVQRLVWPFVVLVVLGGWIATYSEVRLERRDAEKAAISLAETRATLLEQHVVKTLQIASLASFHLGHIYLSPDSAHSATAASARREIAETAVEIAGLSGVEIWDRDGRTLAASGVAFSLPDQGQPGHPAPPPHGPELTVSGPFAVGSSEQKALAVTRRIMRNGRIAGYVALYFRPDQFLNFPMRTTFQATDLVSVISLDGVTLARREGNSFTSGENVAGGLVMRRQLADPNGTYLGPSALDGHVRYFSHRRLDGFPMFVTAGVSHSAALASAQYRAIFYYGILGIVSILAFLMAWLVQHEATYRERKALELAEAAQRLREAQRIGKIGDWECDSASCTLVWSDELCKMYERSSADDHISFAEFASYVAPEDRARLEADFQALLKNGGAHSREFQVSLPSGKVAYRRVNAVAVAGPDGRVVSLYGTDQDVTQELQFRELEMQVAYLDRQGAMSMMAGTLAHELNQPLTAASNYITAALRSTEKIGQDAAGAVASGLRYGLQQIHDAAEIIRHARKMVQISSDQTGTASVREVIANTLALLKASGFDQTSAVRIECEEGIPEVYISRIELQQVFLNILKNALEAAPSDDPRIVIRATRFDDSQLRIQISDNGPGFPDVVDVFSAFYTNKDSGLGLGLSISRTIVEHHSGKLWIEKSEPGATLVVITLPFVGAPGTSDSAEEAFQPGQTLA